jgi:hypothetical protein
VERNVGVVLYTLELHGESGRAVVHGVANQEGEVDELVRVGELREQVKVFR